MRRHAGLVGLLVALAATAGAGQLIGSVIQAGILIDIDRDTGKWTLIGSTGAPFIQGIAYDVTRDVLWGISASSDAIYRIDPKTGRATQIGPNGQLGFGNANAMAFDPIDDVRATAAYRRTAALEIVKRALAGCATTGAAA